MTKQYHASQKRIQACLLFAALVHALGLISFKLPTLSLSSPPKHSLDLVMISTYASQLPAPASQSDQQHSPENPTSQRTMASSKYANIMPTSTPITLKKRTISAHNHRPEDEHYLEKWQARIEEVGNQHYPQVALEKDLRGHLRLMVSLNKDGSVHQISLRQSSGVQALDDAAIHIVQLAAPFDPFPPEIADSVDVLDIIRTWQFNGKLTSRS